MIIKSIAIENIRSHEKFTGSLSKTTTIVIGKNGSGKTSIIESIMLALSGKSFRGSDSELLRYGATWWRIDLALNDQDRTVKYRTDSDTKRKEFILDDKSSARLGRTHKYPVVLFEPDDLRLLHGSPARRRQFIDRFAGQLMPDYGTAVRRYERALLQRNKLLKNDASAESLFAWNVSLAKYGAHIIETRVKLIDRLNVELGDVYRSISDTDDAVSMEYTHDATGNTEQKLLAELEASTDKDKILGFTSIGPHRHDLIFTFNGADADASASRGETRTIILALKFLEVDTIESVDGRKPIVLLDDVFSELDEKRQTQLATNFQNHQIIITTVTTPKGLKTAKVIKLS